MRLPVDWGCVLICDAGFGVTLRVWLRPFSTGAGLGSLFASEACSTPESVWQTRVNKDENNVENNRGLILKGPLFFGEFFLNAILSFRIMFHITNHVFQKKKKKV